MKRIVPTLVALALLVAACTDAAPDAGPGPDEGESSGAGTAAAPTDDRSFAGTEPAPDFPEGLEWINSTAPISIADLRGKVVLLDFWTYGCINCIHIIPDLKRLEAEYPDELVVIGVHSAKFVNEGETENIRNVVQRYEVDHPVVNDRDFAIWQMWGAQAWPTTVLIDPAGNVVGGHPGEGVYDVLQPVIASLVDEFAARDELDRTPLRFATGPVTRADTVLSFPGKVFVHPDTGTLYIADTGHHRIVAAAPGGEVTAVYGNGRAGYADGPALEAQFDSPQGMATSPDGRILYVADTNNHVVRRIDLETGDVTRAVGTGEQGWPPRGGLATEVALASPWALEMRDGLLYVAMAGHHQIWAFDLASDEAAPLVGNSRESTRNGPLAEAELAQPSGLAFDPAGVLYFADSESSSIRSAAVADPAGETAAVVGSDTSLFEFGDVDGVGTAARLQHPLGLAYAADGYLYVADTYNSKIKRVDLDAGRIDAFVGGDQGWQDGATPLFYEPGGLAAAGETLYVADTNNHAVRLVDIPTGATSTLILKGIEEFQPPPDDAAYRGQIVEIDPVTVAAGPGELFLDISLPAEHKINDEAPSSGEFFATGGVADFAENRTLSLTGAELPVRVPVQFATGSGTVTADLTVIYCRETAQSLCLIQQLRFVAPVTVAESGETTISLGYEIELPGS